MPTMRDYQSRILTPGWLQDEFGLGFTSAFGQAKDDQAARAKAAVKSRFPLGTGVVGNALPNPSFSFDGDGDGWPDDWYDYNSRVTAGGYGTAPLGGRSLVCIVGGLAGSAPRVASSWGAAGFRRETSLHVLPGTPYVASVAIRAPAGTVSTLVVKGRDAGTTENVNLGSSLPSTGAWQRLTYQGVATQEAWLFLSPGIIDGAPNGTVYEVAQPLLKVGMGVPAYTDEAFLGAAPSDALPIIGAERGLDRSPLESEASFRRRLQSAWDIWRWAGTPFGMLLALYRAGYTPTSGKVVIRTQKGYQHELRPDFDPDLHKPEESVITTNIGTAHLGGSPELWSQFEVLFAPPPPPAWLPTPPADSSVEVNTIRALIRKWKPAHAQCVSLQAAYRELWDYPKEPWEPTTEVWDEPGANVLWTPP